MATSDPPITMTLEAQPEPADVAVIFDALAVFNRTFAGDDNYRPLAIFLRDRQGVVVGDLVGSTFWEWLRIDLLWVRDDLRGQGHGHRLLLAAEAEAVRRGCGQAFLDTQSFQAPAFYLKRGYRVFSELADFPRGHTRYFMAKRLQPPSEADA